MKILWTGDRGFIAGYVIQKLLDEGHLIYGIDNDWKYGKTEKSYDNHQNYFHYIGDAKDKKLLKDVVFSNNIEYIVAGAAWIGGISFFHELAYDLLAENERLTAAIFDIAIEAYKSGFLKKIIAISSSMVFESTNIFPSKEEDVRNSFPPLSTYGFQKLAVEYFAQGAYEQYKLPYTIVRPFNAVGIGEKRAKIDKEILSGSIKLAMSHVIPDLIQKIIKGQSPLHILGEGNQKRHYTYAGDLADGFYKCIFDDRSLNQDFNLSTPIGYTVLELAEIIWKKIKPNEEFKYVSDDAFKYDVQCRIPSIEKAKNVLKFEALTPLDTALDEVIPWVIEMVKRGEI